MACRCNECGFKKNPDDAHYCGKCGSVLENHWMIYDSSEYEAYTRKPVRGIVNLVLGLACMAYITFGLIYPKFSDVNVQKWSSTWSLIWDLFLFLIFGGIGINMLVFGLKTFLKSR